MAYVNTDAILTRVREVLNGAQPVTRDPGSGVYTATGNPEGVSSDEISRRAMHLPACDPRITSVRRHPASPPNMHSLSLLEFDLEVSVVRHLNDKHRLSSSYRDDVLALALRDGDVISQVLCHPGNLTATEGGTATGIVSGLLEYRGSDVARVELGDGQAGLVETVHRFGGIAQVTQEIMDG